MAIHYFTYGGNHLDQDGSSLGACYTPVSVTNEEVSQAYRESLEWFDGNAPEFSIARHKMCEARGHKWSMHYLTQEEAGVEKWSLSERPLESVSLDLRGEKIDELLNIERESLKTRAANLQQIDALLRCLPLPLLEKAEAFMGGLDLNALTHEEAISAMSALRVGRWEKKPNVENPLAIDYDGVLNGIRVRLWAAAPPGTCRIIEIEEEIPASPAQIIIRRKLVCA